MCITVKLDKYRIRTVVRDATRGSGIWFGQWAILVFVEADDVDALRSA